MINLPILAFNENLLTKFNPMNTMNTFVLTSLITLIIICALYLYFTFAWFTIAKKLGYKYAWLAWIPIINIFILPIVAKKNEWWTIIFAIPVLLSLAYPFFLMRLDYTTTFLQNVSRIYFIVYALTIVFIAIMSVVWLWRIYKLRNYPGWLSLLPLLGIIPVIGMFALIINLIIFGIVAWKDSVAWKDRIPII